MTSSEDIQQLLLSNEPWKHLSENEQLVFILKGMLLHLYEDSSIQAIHTIQIAILRNQIPEIQSQALRLLQDLALRGNQDACDALFQLEIDHDYPPAQEFLLAHHLKASSATLQALHFLLNRNPEQLNQVDPGWRLVSDFIIHSASNPLNERLFAAAKSIQRQDWVDLIHAIQQVPAEEKSSVSGLFPGLTPEDQLLALNLLAEQFAQNPDSAGEQICELFINRDFRPAQEMASRLGIAPEDPVQRALFYFLSGDWNAYERLDFTHSLLAGAYNDAVPDLRRRLLTFSRYNGRIDWLEAIPSAEQSHWSGDLSDADWASILKLLSREKRWEDIWRLAQKAPAYWSAELLSHLASHAWQPERPDQVESFKALAELAISCQKNPLKIHLKHVLKVLNDEITCLSLSPDGKWLATGGKTHEIALWELAHLKPIPETLIGPYPVTTSVCISPDNQYLAAANADQKIRIYKIPEKKILKTLAGHSSIIKTIQIDPDSRSLFSASFDGSIRAWRFPQGIEMDPVTRNEREWFSLAVNPSGERLLAAGASHTLKVWKMPERVLLREIAGHEDIITFLAVSPTGQLAVTFSRDHTLRIWNFESGKQIRKIDFSGVVTAVSFYPDEHVFCTGTSQGEITLWSSSTGQALHTWKGHDGSVVGIAFTPDGQTLITAGSNSKVNFWNLRTFMTVRTPGSRILPDFSAQLQKELNQKNLETDEKSWLKFTLELSHLRQRFDIEIEEPQIIQIGEFDIQL